MIPNYLKIAVRSFMRHRLYAVMNVLGLALGIACCFIILAFVSDETKYDRFHEKGGRIYRVVYSNSDDGQPTNANSSYSIGPAMKADFPDVERAVRFVKMGWGEKRVFARGDRRFYEGSFFFADPEVFDVFTFPLIDGNPQTALVEPHTIVVTRSAAEKYFGSENPLGKTISADPFNDGSFRDYEVTGVMDDIPRTSHIKFDFLLSFASLPGTPQGWGLDPVFNYVLLSEGADARRLEAKIPAFLDRHLEHFGHPRWFVTLLQPVLDIHLHSDLRAELEPNGSIDYVYIFSAIALFILLIACINFTNLATARAARRAKEVGLRKVAGARRGELVRQFLTESVLMSILAGIIAVGLAWLLLPVFNSVAGTDLSLQELMRGRLIAIFVLLTIGVGVLAGAYPSFVLSGFRPAMVLKGALESGGSRSALLRKGLVVFQFAVSILLISCTAVVSMQMSLVRNMDLGFDREHIMVLPLNEAIRESYPSFRRQLLSSSAFIDASLTEQVPARAGNGSAYIVEGIDGELGFSRFFVDAHFAQTYGIEMAAGRPIAESFATDSTDAYMVNEALVRELGFDSPEDAVGKGIRMWWDGREWAGRIVGVAKDFHLFSLRGEVTPVVINQMPLAYLNFVSIRLAPGNTAEALSELGDIWAEFASGYPLEYYFLDDDFENLHQADRQLGEVFTSFAVLAIVIACLGLFALAAFTAEQRTKEIGVRKVLGATSASIVRLLSKEYTRLIILAFILAAPAAYLIMSSWLEDFTYRIDLDVWVFALAGLAAVAVAWGTVGYQTLRAALADPVESLRYE